MNSADPNPRDWFAWHDSYDDAASPHSQRLRIVQREILRALPAAPASFQVISLCAGQGDDLIGALGQYAWPSLIRARLVELDARNWDLMRQKARRAGLDHLEMIQADAALPSLYADIVPADLVLLCGIFGNISNDDIRHTIGCASSLCRTGGSLIWTRSRRPPDLTPSIRQWFREAGFEETAFEAPAGTLVSVGAARFQGQPQPLGRERFFRFLE